MNRITEQPSPHRRLEQKSIPELLELMNGEDQKVAQAVQLALPQIQALTEAVVDHLLGGGRLFYIGAGTSGRLGILDASECPPTFGVPTDLVIGLIAGGERAIRHPVEQAEDSSDQAWKDLQNQKVSRADIVIGIAASGSTPYVVHGLIACQKAGITTACITCNPATPLAEAADFPVEVITGPEFITGSTRMKAGTAQKMVLNMISTVSMIQLGRVEDNRMVDMQLTNEKLLDRGTRMVVEQTGLDYHKARELLLKQGSVRQAVLAAG